MPNMTRYFWTLAALCVAVATLPAFFAVTAALGLDSPQVPHAVATVAVGLACYASFCALASTEVRTAALRGDLP